jgi:hypothetical protein
MNQSLKFFILAAFSIKGVLAINSSFCNYTNTRNPFDAHTVYSCMLVIGDPLTSIGGSHSDGFNDKRVYNLVRRIGMTREFPKIVCEKFIVLEHISVRAAGIEIIKSEDLRSPYFCAP